MVRFRLMSASVVTVAAALGLPATALRSTEVTSQMAAPRQFGYTGSQQSYLVPSGVMLEGVYVQGAWGGAYGASTKRGRLCAHWCLSRLESGCMWKWAKTGRTAVRRPSAAGERQARRPRSSQAPEANTPAQAGAPVTFAPVRRGQKLQRWWHLAWLAPDRGGRGRGLRWWGQWRGPLRPYKRLARQKTANPYPRATPLSGRYR